MVDFINKALFESYQEGTYLLQLFFLEIIKSTILEFDQNVMKITESHCESALKTVTETCLSGVNLLPSGDKSLDDIGGLADVKKLLIETMLWPAKV